MSTATSIPTVSSEVENINSKSQAETDAFVDSIGDAENSSSVKVTNTKPTAIAKRQEKSTLLSDSKRPDNDKVRVDADRWLIKDPQAISYPPVVQIQPASEIRHSGSTRSAGHQAQSQALQHVPVIQLPQVSQHVPAYQPLPASQQRAASPHQHASFNRVESQQRQASQHVPVIRLPQVSQHVPVSRQPPVGHYQQAIFNRSVSQQPPVVPFQQAAFNRSVSQQPPESLFRNVGVSPAANTLSSVKLKKQKKLNPFEKLAQAFSRKPRSKSVEINERVQLARKLELEGRFPEAIQKFEALLQKGHGSVLVFHRLAVLYDKTGQADRALPFYQKALAQEPFNAELLTDIGFRFAIDGDYQNAEKYLNLALNHSPHLDRAHNNLAVVLARTNRQDLALGHFRQAGCTQQQASHNLSELTATQ